MGFPQLRLAILEEFRAALVGSKRLLERELSRFHGGDDAFDLGKRLFE